MVLPRVGRPLRILGGGVVFDFGNRSAHLGASIFDVMESRARTQKMTIIKVTHSMALPPQARRVGCLGRCWIVAAGGA